MDKPLTDRQRRLLALVVQDYVRTAQPVASGPLVRRYRLGVSPATVRNDLVALENAGLLTQPHTSAGRVPTVAGYRYFVEHLMQTAALPERERRTIRHQFHQAAWDAERWMSLSAAVMARVSGVAGLVAAEEAHAAPLRRVELLDAGDGVVHVIAVLGGGFVRQARWHPGRAFDQATLDRVSQRFNAALDRGGPVAEADETPAGSFDLAAVEAVEGMLDQAARSGTPRYFHAGLAQILHAPEFADGQHLRGVVELLEYGQGLERIIGRLPPTGVQVIIGGEPPLEQCPYVTLVLARFGQPALPAGVLGVVGPTRMAYERAVSTVNFMAGLMNQLIAGEAV